MATDLIHPRTRHAFREHCSAQGFLRSIEQAFEMEGFEKGPESDSDGQRRGRFDAYANKIDWSNPSQVKRSLRVFEEMLSWTWDEEHGHEANRRLVRLLERDGFVVDAKGLIEPGVVGRLESLPLDSLADPAAIEEHLRRLETTGDNDPPLAISSAKALVEATSKLVLVELGEPFDEKSDLPALVKAVQKALRLHPESIAPTARGRETITRTLSNLSQVTIGVAELRNEYGPDHGRSRPVSGLGPRHAHLAIGAAATFCRFILETLAERK